MNENEDMATPQYGGGGFVVDLRERTDLKVFRLNMTSRIDWGHERRERSGEEEKREGKRGNQEPRAEDQEDKKRTHDQNGFIM